MDPITMCLEDAPGLAAIANNVAPLMKAFFRSPETDARDEWELRNGLTSRVKLVMERKGLTREQALVYLKQIAEDDAEDAGPAVARVEEAADVSEDLWDSIQNLGMTGVAAPSVIGIEPPATSAPPPAAPRELCCIILRRVVPNEDEFRVKHQHVAQAHFLTGSGDHESEPGRTASGPTQLDALGLLLAELAQGD